MAKVLVSTSLAVLLTGPLLTGPLLTGPLLTGPLLPAEPDCPQDARIYGAPPPTAGERYCGKPLPDGRIVRHGWYTAWFGNGHKATEGEYQDGLRVSTWSRAPAK